MSFKMHQKHPVGKKRRLAAKKRRLAGRKRRSFFNVFLVTPFQHELFVLAAF